MSVEFRLEKEDFQIYGNGGWMDVSGRFSVYIGSSSADIRSTGTIDR